MGFLQRLFQQLRQVWSGMSVARRIGLTVLTGFCCAAIIGVGIWASQPNYRVLFSGLAAEEAGVITAKLQAQNISFRLADNGTTVLVPDDQVQQLRLSLAMEGLPEKGGKGWELFDNSPLGTTPLQQHVNYVRALQAELARSIMKFEPVALARVHIVRPEATPFIKEQKPTTASVILKLKPGASLTRDKAAGIQLFVSRSVEGLQPEQVTVLDTTGRTLSDNRNPAEAGSFATTQLEYQRELESYLAAKAEEMLALALGPHRAVVRVTAGINFKKKVETKETYNNDDKVVLEEVLLNHKENNSAPSPSGVAGAGSNLGKKTPAPAPTRSNTKQEENIRTKYAVSKIIQKFEDRVGNIEQISVAALVDLSKGEGDDARAAPMTRDVAENLIKQAVGFKTGRDQITVTDVKLAGANPQAGMEAEWQETQRWQRYTQLARKVSLGIAALIALGISWLLLRRLRPRATAAVPAAEPSEQERIRTSVTEAARKDPDAVARILTLWVKEPPQKAAA